MTGLAPEVCVIGGGLAGASTALHLARRGLSVVVLDKGLAGTQASGVNFGGVRQNGRHLAEIPLAMRSRALWDRFPELIGEDVEFRVTGHLRMGRTEDDVTVLETFSREVGKLGLPTTMLRGNALRERWPWLGTPVVAGCFCPNDGHANPRLLGPGFARAARKAGADVREGEEALGLERDPRGFRVTTRSGLEVQSRVLVNAAGAWGAAIAARFGETVPMHAIAPQMIVTEPAPHRIEPVLGIVGGAIYLRQIERGNVIFGGGDGIADTTRTRSTVLPEATIGAAAVAHALIPHLRHLTIIRVWTGIEGETEDLIPVLGPSGTTPGLFHAFGFSRHGFLLGPVVGLVMSELILDGATPSPIAPFSIERFAVGRTDSGPR